MLSPPPPDEGRKGLRYPFQRQGPLLPQEWPLGPQISGNNTVVGNLNELQVSQCLCQGIKPLWNQRGGQLSSWSSLGSQARDTPSRGKTGQCSGYTLGTIPFLFYCLLLAVPKVGCFAAPTDLVQAAFSKIILDSLEAWGASKLPDTVLSSGLLPRSSHGSAQMSVLTCMCLRRSLPDQRT